MVNIINMWGDIFWISNIKNLGLRVSEIQCIGSDHDHAKVGGCGVGGVTACLK